jgi:hypothetical protein
MDFCTLTGIDEATDLRRIGSLSAEHPFAEWGVLLSESRAGSPTDLRYPSLEWIDELTVRMASDLRHANFALHVCGKAVHGLLNSGGRAAGLSKAFGRIQLNFHSRRIDVGSLREFVASRKGQTVVTQHNAANEEVWMALGDLGNHAVLFDASGGRGAKPSKWPPPLPGKACGYAGGLGPETLAEDLDAIAEACGGQPKWIDMEGRLRKGDVFDLPSAQRCLIAAAEWRNSNAMADGLRKTSD